MMKQYMDIKKRYREEILFFRMGDFYEMFFEDAHVSSKILDIALTSRQNNIPMCGIPYHAAENYISRLIKAGKRVAICEQLENIPSEGTIVRRGVVRIITPGTVIESNLLPSDDNNFLGSIIISDENIGLSFIDISTGDFYISSIEKSMEIFRGEIIKFNPSEIVLREGGSRNDESFIDFIKAKNLPIYKINDWLYDYDFMKNLICDTFKVANTKGLGLISEIDIISAGSILQYLNETHKKTLDHLKHPRKLFSSDIMILDDATISNLELVHNQNDRTKNRTLLSVLNFTKTPMGKRTLERNILQPLSNPVKIDARLDIIQYFFEYHDFTAHIRSHLNEIFDIERVITRFAMGKILPGNFITLRDSIVSFNNIIMIAKDQPHDDLKKLAKNSPDLDQILKIIEEAVEDNPAISPEQGRVIRKGFLKELDRLYDLKNNAKNWILEYQDEERKKLGFSSLRIKYNKILGYFIEISKVQAKAVSEEYYRKQTLVNSERFTTEKLQKFESEILSASEKINKIEKQEIDRICMEILKSQRDIQRTAEIIGEIDYYCSLSIAAIENNYTRPIFSAENITHIKEGRHPVVEKYYTNEVFIPNDVNLDNNENIIKIITGPNMSGKSTYIRMYAIIQLMAQIGSFVPAKAAELSAVNRIFTRIGASDNISRGESTFLVEMNETANILNNATDKSLIIMDEIGRGTSTYDGLSIAWAIVEYILRYIKSKTLFATHYHELTRLGNKKGIVNYNVLVKEHLSGVDFLHKVVKGATDKSYGIHVAKLAGIPEHVISRGEKILEKLEKTAKGGKLSIKNNEGAFSEQLEIFNASNHLVIKAIKNIDIDKITPVDALNELNRLKRLID